MVRAGPSLFAIFVIIPISEVVLFILAGSSIGVGPTIVLVVLTAVVGAAIVSRQGRAVLWEARSDLATGQFPARPLAHGVMILVAGALLLTPGFFTDVIGFLLLVPAFREVLRRWAVARFRPDVTIIP